VHGQLGQYGRGVAGLDELEQGPVPADMVGCDDDGVIVVPAEVADEVAVHARAILLADMRARRKHYEALGIKPDTSVDHEAVEAYYATV